MKKFLKFLGALLTVFSAAIAALAVFDRFSNKNRIRNGYLECNVNDAETEE